MQVGLLAAMKTNTQEADADVKWFIQILAIWEMGDSCLQAHLHISVEAEVFIRMKRGIEQRDQRRGLESSLGADQQSPI